MSLRNKLLALSLLTLLLPWSAWKLLQELERFLRDNQEAGLLASARSLSSALPLEFQSRLQFAPDLRLPLRVLSQPPILDGYPDEWPEAQHGFEFSSDDDELNVRLMAGWHGGLTHLFIVVDDNAVSYASPAASPPGGDSVRVYLRNARGMQSWFVSPEAPGPIRIPESGAGGGELTGYWLEETADAEQQQASGYRLELTLPVATRLDTAVMDLSLEVVDHEPGADSPRRRLDLANHADGGSWISLGGQWLDLSDWLTATAPPGARAWLIDGHGWVLADSGDQETLVPGTTWMQRLLYRIVSDQRPRVEELTYEAPVRMVDEPASQALDGQGASIWVQDLETAVVRNTVAVPVEVAGKIRGALVMQSSSDGLLLMTNRALGQLLLTTVGLMLALAAGLWYYASRLSRRVQRLSSAVSHAMDGGAATVDVPLVADRDELGELARNNQKLLRAVAEYNQYLQTLAGKLSHELKTPLAITRSSLDNLDDQALDEESRRFVERAREGLDRQGEIVRAMSEASKLEQAVKVAEWESIDIGELVTSCVEGYRAAYHGRSIEIGGVGGRFSLRCAPDLLAQALDKLVDNAISMSGRDDRVVVGVEKQAAQILLSVTNTGSRLPGELVDRLFDSLVSVRDKRSDTPHLGLGLYIVRLVAEAHGGRVEACNIERADGEREGVRFTIALPTTP